ncbi:MAG: RNA polymerase sigma factor [Bryobacter sp.]|jgi:RNA polymerase sigma-70 factor (ECF subfamily)|nr:RNA polymerase sigma factor [Bryobacter sp.]
MHGEPGIEPTIESLLAGYQAGDEQAVARLVARCGPMLFRFFYGLGSPPAEAEDLVQETWLRIHQARRTYRPDAPAMPWLFAIARHARADAYRRRARIERAEVKMAALPEPIAPAAASPGQPDTFRLLQRLPDAQREVLVMLKGEGMSLEEVAAATSSTVGAVKQKAHRAYENLRRFLRGDR